MSTRWLTWPGSTHERGAVSAFVIVAAFAVLVATGMAIDGGSRARAAARADAIADEAGRAAAQHVIPAPAVRGQAVTIDPEPAAAAAHAYLAEADARGVIDIADTQVHVATEVTWQPIILDLIGVEPQPLHGEATVRLVQP